LLGKVQTGLYVRFVDWLDYRYPEKKILSGKNVWKLELQFLYFIGHLD